MWMLGKNPQTPQISQKKLLRSHDVGVPRFDKKIWFRKTEMETHFFAFKSKDMKSKWKMIHFGKKAALCKSRHERRKEEMEKGEEKNQL